MQPDLVFTTPLLNAKFARLLQKTGTVLVGSGDPASLQVRRDIALRDSAGQRAQVRAVFFTSGTTGVPKGVCLSESNLLSAAFINTSILNLDSSHRSSIRRSLIPRSLITVPLFDYYGVIQLYSHLLAKAACTLGESGQFPGPRSRRSLRTLLPTLCWSLLP